MTANGPGFTKVGKNVLSPAWPLKPRLAESQITEAGSELQLLMGDIRQPQLLQI